MPVAEQSKPLFRKVNKTKKTQDESRRFYSEWHKTVNRFADKNVVELKK